jgi:solute carrier family 25 (peroxisomal adenine nucleotide transporter), member 17
MPESIASEVIAASLGGAVSATVLYPLEVLKTKMQATTTTTSDDDDEESLKDDKTVQPNMITVARTLYQKEGAQVFIRGVETSAFQSALEKALYFLSYTGLKNGYTAVTQRPATQMSTATNLLLGCLAEWAHLPITLPVDVWTTAIQTTSKTGGSSNTPMTILITLLNDPTVNFYKGISAYYLLCFKPAIQYTVYEQVKTLWIASKNQKQRKQTTTLSALESFLLGMVARTVATVLIFPFLRAKVLMQAQLLKDSSSEPPSEQPSLSVQSLLMQIYQRDGLAGLYQGIGPELTRGVFSAALMLMLKEQIAAIVQTMIDR